MAPLVAFLHFAPDWSPQADPAFMELRSLDTGTARTPLLGQPSQSHAYVRDLGVVHHPGPWHLYLMALPVRVLGGAIGMLSVSAAITGACLVATAWAVYRQLGRTAGLVAAVALSAVAFTTGASSLVHPVSSSIAGYPLVLSAVLCWCLAAGDVRLLPVTVGVVSFTVQQHLSVVPAGLVLLLGGLVVGAVSCWRTGLAGDAARRRELARSAAGAALVGLVLWAPVLAQQAFGDVGNLGRIAWFARHGDQEQLGLGAALWQVVHALGLPPLLGRTSVTGTWLTSRPSAVGWASAAVVAGVVARVSWRARGTDPRRAALGAMVGVVVVAGLVNGSSVPVGVEQRRLSFYHWAFVLALLVALVIGLALVPAARSVARRRSTRVRKGAVGVVVVAVALPPLLGVAIDRPTNTSEAAADYLDTTILDALVDAGVAHADRLGDEPVVLVRNPPPFLMFGPSLGVALIERGVDAHFPLQDRFFVHDDHLVDRDGVDGGLVLVVDDELAEPAPAGELIAAADLGTGLAVDDFRALSAAARGADTVELGDALAGSLSPSEVAVVAALLDDARRDPEALLRPDLLRFLADHPAPVSPALDPRRAARLLTSLRALDRPWRPGTPTGVRLFLLDRDEVLAEATAAEIGRPTRR